MTASSKTANLLISGSQEVRVNHELRILMSQASSDAHVDADNVISYAHAEARISYGGRGRLTEVQQPPWGQQLVDLVSPL